MKLRSKSKAAAAAAGTLTALVGATQSAEAAIVHVSDRPVTSTEGGTSFVEWDVDGVGGRDFRFVLGGTAGSYIQLSDDNNFFVKESADLNEVIHNLASDFEVGPGLAAGYEFKSIAFSSPVMRYGQIVDLTAGTFDDDQPGFVGFQFATPTGTNFGWGRITFDEDAHSVTVSDWAYEDSGGSILAGDIGAAAVPEPSSLGLLAMGVAGVATWRRKRKPLNTTSA